MNNILRSFVLSTFTLGALAFAAPTKYALDPAHSELGFKVAHLVISTVKGTFDKFDGGFEFDPIKNVITNLQVNVDIHSVNTKEADRDKHLKSDDFFSADKFPKATFTAKEVKLTNNKGVAKGELEMRGKKLPFTLNVTYKGSIKDAWGNDKSAFEASGELNRKDYGISWNKALDNGGLTVGDQVTLEITAEAAPTKDEKAPPAAKKAKKEDKKVKS